MQGEAAEAADFDTITRRQRLGHLLEHGLDGQLDILWRKQPLVRNNPLDQLRLGHAFPFYFKQVEQLRNVLACSQGFEQPKL